MNIERKYDAWLPITSYNKIMKVLIVKMCELTDMSSTMLRTLAVVRGLLLSKADVEMLVLSNNELQKKYEFLNDVCINVLESGNTKSNDLDKKSSEIKAFFGKVARKIYHRVFPFDKTYFKVNKIELSNIRYKYYDVIISDSDPKTSHVACKTLISKGLKYGKWVEYWGDPLAADITVKTIYPKTFLKYIEQRLFDKADKIVYTSPFTLEDQKKAFTSFSDKMFYVPTGYLEHKIFELPKEGKAIVTYTGAYYSTVRNIIPLYEACKELDQVKCIITGDTDLKLPKASNIEIQSRGPADYELKISSLIVCIMNQEGCQIPGKLYHCAGTNKKILVILDGDNIEETQLFIQQWNRFYYCLNNKDDIKEAIKRIIADKQEWSPLKEFAPDVVANSLIG